MVCVRKMNSSVIPLNVSIQVCDVTATLIVVTSPMNFTAVSNHGNYLAFVLVRALARVLVAHSVVRWLVESSVHLVNVFAY